MKNEMRKEILRLANGASWAENMINQLVTEGMELLEIGKAKDIKHAAFKVIDARY